MTFLRPGVLFVGCGMKLLQKKKMLTTHCVMVSIVGLFDYFCPAVSVIVCGLTIQSRFWCL